MNDAAPPATLEPEPAEPATAAAADPAGDVAGLADAVLLDTRGLACPLPILKTKKALAGLAAGGVLRIVSTDPGSVPDLAAFAAQTGHAILHRTEGGGEYTFWLRKR
jgi:tRNA 2-thiouridine synthesizing protein A